MKKQECIPVGCIPATCWPYLIVSYAPEKTEKKPTPRKNHTPLKKTHILEKPCPQKTMPPEKTTPKINHTPGLNTPPLWTESQTPVKTLPWPNFVAAGNYLEIY